VTLETYADAICAALNGPTMLVGHSMAGFPITVAADRMPTTIAKLIYLCAHVPLPGHSIADMRLRADTQPLAEAMVPSADPMHHSIAATTSAVCKTALFRPPIRSISRGTGLHVTSLKCPLRIPLSSPIPPHWRPT